MRNKFMTWVMVFTALSLWLTTVDLEARGGRGGGGGGRSGGGRGGSYRGGQTLNRTPTMSRTASRPVASQARSPSRVSPTPKPSRTSVSQRSVSQARVAAQRPTNNRAEIRNQVNQYAQNRPSTPINRNNLSNNRSNQIAQNRQISDRASQRLRQTRPDSNHWFDRNFFDRHNIDLDYVGNGANWWKPAAWATLATWGDWGWSTPYYYDGGYAYPISYESTYPENTTTTTTNTTTQYIEPNQVITTQQQEWLPLGVFAVGNDANSAAYTNRFLQLALNRKGEISGVLYNSTTDTTQDLTGHVDPTSQKAFWSLSNQINSPIASTGIYNLTEDQTPINVYFPDGSNQTWTLVRLQE